jgi:hypothetical protein
MNGGIINSNKVASCWLFLLSHITMHGSMNIKCILIVFALSYPPHFFLILIQETGMLVSVVTLHGTELHIDDAEIRLCDTSDKKM